MERIMLDDLLTSILLCENPERYEHGFGIISNVTYSLSLTGQLCHEQLLLDLYMKSNEINKNLLVLASMPKYIEAGGCLMDPEGWAKDFCWKTSQEATVDDLRQYFGRFGRVDVYVPKDPKELVIGALGFVTFAG
ncbi:hypothetical protein HPP92_018689 [Vanilla planifolia]|uniref:RRM domain-containing protein n=1 Tax=Vanilla planifolia TaxID=51239 RepID=A0A835URT0_VANPL|nr:hypothetical protein HPP92_018689 [Vanilla planifolia]